MKISLIGAGAMGTAFVKGVVTSGFLAASDVYAFDTDNARVKLLIDEFGCVGAGSARDAVREGDYIVVCVKPALVRGVLEDLQAEIGPNKVVVSIAAGVTLQVMQAALRPGTPVIRVMPNTPAMVGKGASALAAGSAATTEQLEFAARMFESFGVAVIVNEALMDAVTGLSGSGPAFVYTFIEAMADAGVSCGLPRDTACKLAAQTVSGAAEMVLQSGVHPAALRDQVTSPGGTTIAGIAQLERSGFRAAVFNAVQAAAQRSAEMGK